MDKPQLDKAYRNTIYRIYTGDENFDLLIDEVNPKFESWCLKEGVQSWILITAANPYSNPLSIEENRKLNLKLSVEIEMMGYNLIHAEGLPTEPDWEAEPGFMVYNISLENGKTLGNSAHQNAIVFGDSETPPALIWLQ